MLSYLNVLRYFYDDEVVGSLNIAYLSHLVICRCDIKNYVLPLYL